MIVDVWGIWDLEPGEYNILMTPEIFNHLYGTLFIPVGKKDKSEDITIKYENKSR